MKSKKNIRSRNRIDTEEPMSFWQSYSDLMAALLLLFVLIMSLTLLQAKMDYDQKLKEQQEQEELIMQQQEKIDKLVGVRLEIIQQLSEAFEKSNLKVSVDKETGAITFDSSVLFDFNKYEIKPAGKAFLKEFLPNYFGILLSEENRQYISEIIIEGHADSVGDYIDNLYLSQQRAYSVAEFCLRDNNGIVSKKRLKELRKVVTANGRSFSNPVLNEDGTINDKKSRRVELKFRLKDEEMIAEMQDLLGGQE